MPVTVGNALENPTRGRDDLGTNAIAWQQRNERVQDRDSS